jgi:hypothetical protein
MTAARRIPDALSPAAERLLEMADDVAAGLRQGARSHVTSGRERAVLRLLGVSGLDRTGRPLAAEVVDRFVAGDRARLATGVGLPFALALDEYDTTPGQLALDVAAGLVDLAAEAALLAQPERLAAAQGRLTALVDAAAERIDANRVARAELRRALGEAGRPWLGVELRETEVGAALGELAARCRDGADLVRVAVPVGRELASELGAHGRSVAHWQPPTPSERGAPPADEPVPAGSQRGLARLRDGLDRQAVERGAYLRLAIAPSALAGPEGALVAAVERADLLELDPMHDIVAVGVDPNRALADLVPVAALCRRAEVPIVLGPGPLVVGPELAAGRPADEATRAGRAFALQLLAARLLAGLGLEPHLVVAGGLAPWTLGEPAGVALALAGLAVREATLAGHDLAFVESPSDAPDASGRWIALIAAISPVGRTAVVLLAADDTRAATHGLRAAATVSAELVGSLEPGGLAGLAADHAAGLLRAADETLRRLRAEGFAWLQQATPAPGIGATATVGAAVNGPAPGSLGGGAVASRSGSGDATVRLLG